jgi:hypothetical protein
MPSVNVQRIQMPNVISGIASSNPFIKSTYELSLQITNENREALHHWYHNNSHALDPERLQATGDIYRGIWSKWFGIESVNAAVAGIVEKQEWSRNGLSNTSATAAKLIYKVYNPVRNPQSKGTMELLWEDIDSMMVKAIPYFVNNKIADLRGNYSTRIKMFGTTVNSYNNRRYSLLKETDTTMLRFPVALGLTYIDQTIQQVGTSTLSNSSVYLQVFKEYLSNTIQFFRGGVANVDIEGLASMVQRIESPEA